jgi:hypothetical protein
MTQQRFNLNYVILMLLSNFYNFVLRYHFSTVKIYSFHSRTGHFDITKFYHQLIQKRIALQGLLKFTLKQLQHVSV